MTWKFAWCVAYGLAATALLASGAQAEAVRLTASNDDLSWEDGKIQPSPVYFTEDPPPPPPKLKPKQGIGSGAESLSSPSDAQPPKAAPPAKAPAAEGPVQGEYAPLQKNGGYAPLQKNGGYAPLQKNGGDAVQKEGGYAPLQKGIESPLQKNGDHYASGCGIADAGCGYESAPSCGYDVAPSCGYDSAPSCGYDNACYGDCFCPSSCCSRWSVRAEALFLERSNASEQVIATAPGGASINAADWNFGGGAGPRLSVFYRGFMDTCWDLEATYWGIHSWNETETLAGATIIATTPVINIGGGAAVTSNYRSRLDSSELNLRRPMSNWATFLMGVRWIEEAEDLTNDIGGIASHTIDVNNHLYGVQMGFDTVLWNRGCPWWVEGIGKVGVYHISSDVTTTTAGVGGALPLITAADNDTAFTADLGVTAVYRWTNNVDFRLGYNLFWIDGLADAPSQMATTNITTGAATVDMDNTQFYHGASIGIEIRR